MNIPTSQYFKKIPPISNFPREFSRSEIEKARAITVGVWDIHTQQETIDLDYAKRCKNKKTPLAVRLNGMIVLIDGHHRIVKKMNEGFRQVQIKVLSL
jgi:hypothetical protein